MLEELKNPKGYLVNGIPKTLGGHGKVPESLIKDCLANMKTFVALAAETSAAEFPAYDILAAFSIFDVSEATRKRMGAIDSAEFIHNRAQRLCQVFKTDLTCFLSEFYDHQPIALHLAVAHDLPKSWDAWSMAVQRTRERKQIMSRHPSNHLVKVMMRYGAFQGCTTSGVEQSFARMIEHIDESRQCMSIPNQVYATKIVLDHARCGPTAVNRLAGKIWEEKYGPPRHRATARIDKGVKRARKD